MWHFFSNEIHCLLCKDYDLCSWQIGYAWFQEQSRLPGQWAQLLHDAVPKSQLQDIMPWPNFPSMLPHHPFDLQNLHCARHNMLSLSDRYVLCVQPKCVLGWILWKRPGSCAVLCMMKNACVCYITECTVYCARQSGVKPCQSPETLLGKALMCGQKKKCCWYENVDVDVLLYVHNKVPTGTCIFTV